MKPRFQQKFVATMALLASLVVSTNTWAGVIFYSTSFSVTDVYSDPVGDSFSGTLSGFQSLQLPRFDATFGTLQGVQLEFQSTYEILVLGQASDTRAEFDFIPVTNVTYNERNDAGIDALVQSTFQMQLFDPSSINTTLSAPSVNAFCYEHISSLDNVLCFAQVGSPTAYNALMPLGALGLTDFVGTDPINLFTSFNGAFSGTCDSNDLGDVCELGVRINWLGLVGVTYTFGTDDGGNPPGGDDDPTSVPEPGSILLMAIGLVLLVLLRRRPVAMSGGRLTR